MMKKELLGPIFIIFIFFVIGIFIFLDAKDFMDNAVPTVSTVEEVERIRTKGKNGSKTKYNALVDYTFNNEDYNDVKVHDVKSSLREGDSLKILVDKRDPLNIRVDTNHYIAPICLLSFITLCAFIIGKIYIKEIKKDLKDKEAKQNGKHFIGKVVGYEEDLTYSSNKQHPTILVCMYTDDFGNRNFASSRPNFKYNTIPKGTEVNIYIYNEHTFVEI
jgi:hypothetical protein